MSTSNSNSKTSSVSRIPTRRPQEREHQRDPTPPPPSHDNVNDENYENYDDTEDREDGDDQEDTDFFELQQQANFELLAQYFSQNNQNLAETIIEHGDKLGAKLDLLTKAVLRLVKTIDAKAPDVNTPTPTPKPPVQG
jgi:transcription termination factor NusB